jgi:hypothetical protein
MNPLEIVVTGNIDGAKSSLQTVQNELGKTALAAQKTDSAISSATSNMQGGLQKVSPALNSLTSQLGKTALAAVKTDSSLSSLTSVAAGSGGAFAELGESLPTGGFLLIGAAIFEAGRKLYEWITAESEAAKTQRLLNTAINESIASVTSEVTKLQTLVSVARDASNSTEIRQNAINELNKEYPDYLGNLTLENINTKKVTDSIDIQIKSIERLAKTKALSRLVDKTAEEVAAAKQKYIEDSKGGYFKSGNLLDDAKDYLTLSKRLDAYTAALISATKEETKAVPNTGRLKQIDDQISFLKQQKELHASTLAETKDYNAKIKKLQDERDLIDPDQKKPKKEHIKKTNPFEIALKDLEDNYKKAQALLVSQYDANLTDAKKNTTAVNDLVLKAQQDFLEKKLALIKRYGKKEGDTDLEIAKVNKALIANQIGFNIEQINTLPKVQGAPSINFKKATTEKIDPKPYYVLSDAIQKNIKLQAAQLQLFNDTAAFLNKDLGPAFDALFTNILDGSGNAFKAFGDAIKQMLVQMAAAILKAAAFAAILSLLPGSAQFGTIFTKSLSGIVPGFASGGSISGPGTSTSDSILARVSNGEYIMKANAVSKFGASFFDGLNSGRLPKFASGGPVGSNTIVASDNHVFIPEVTLKGQDLIVVFNRANQRASRNG